MSLYDIKSELEEAMEKAIDPETGEISKDMDAYLDKLTLELSEKRENIALWIKNLKAESDAVKGEARKLIARAKAADNKAERLKNYLSYNLDGEKFSTPRVAISYRNSKAVEVEADAWKFLPDRYLRYKDPEPNKDEIGKALKAGQKVPGCILVDNVSMIIK